MPPRPAPRRNTAWRPAAVLGLIGGAALLAFLVVSGTVFQLTNGSQVGLLLGIALLWSASVLFLAGLWVGFRGLRRATSTATITTWRPARNESTDREDAA